MKNEKTSKNIFARIFSIFKYKRVRNILYLLLIAFATVSMFLIDEDNTFRNDHLSFLNNNVFADLMDIFGVERYNVTSGAWVLFIILATLTLTIVIGNIVAPKFVANKVKDNPNLLSTEKKTRAFYFCMFYGVLVLIAAVIVVISYFAGAFSLYGANAENPFISLLIMLGIFLAILFAALIVIVLVYSILRIFFMAITGQFITRSKKAKPVAAVETAEKETVVAATAAEPVKEEKPAKKPAAKPAAKPTAKPAAKPAAAPKLEISGINRKVVQKSFVGKMSQAKKEQKEFYNELKNYLLSFNRVNSRVSWHYDSFNIGRQKAVKIAFRGQTMVAYLALDPKKYQGTKYYPHDMSKKKKFADTPMMVKIKSERGVKFTKELIAVICEGLTPKKNFVAATYKFPAMSDKKLVENGLAKTVYVKI
nr:hypothetical protein [Clostridia bacterium]